MEPIAMVRLNTNPTQPPSQDKPQSFSEETAPLMLWELPDDVTLPPMNLDSDEPPLESDLHRNQIDLLIRLLKSWWCDRDDFYISGNLTVYYSAQQTKKRDFRGPDVFIVLGTQKGDRRSWTIWEEGGKYPNLVIELLSNSTTAIDRGKKKELYQDVWRLPEYYWFHPDTLEFAGFRLVGSHYEAIVPDEKGRLKSEQLGLELGVHERQLRWFTGEGELIALPEEQERQAREQERQAKERAEQRVEKLEAYLRSQGIDPNQLPE